MATFEILPDWESRYQYLDELGAQLAPMKAADKTEQNRVFECMSLVHVNAKRDADNPEIVHFDGDCDTPTIKGVIAVIVTLFSGKTPEEALATDINQTFKQLQLFSHLSPNRHVGVYAIEKKMKAQILALIA